MWPGRQGAGSPNTAWGNIVLSRPITDSAILGSTCTQQMLVGFFWGKKTLIFVTFTSCFTGTLSFKSALYSLHKKLTYLLSVSAYLRVATGSKFYESETLKFNLGNIETCDWSRTIQKHIPENTCK